MLHRSQPKEKKKSFNLPMAAILGWSDHLWVKLTCLFLLRCRLISQLPTLPVKLVSIYVPDTIVYEDGYSVNAENGRVLKQYSR